MLLSPRAIFYSLRHRLLRREMTLWYDPAYRLPLSGLETAVGLEPRRADHVAWWLRECHAVSTKSLRAPRRASFAELARAHTPQLLESLGHAESLAHVFGVDPSDVPVDEVLNTVRLACGATVDAARDTLRRRVPALNLLGGFHHASPGIAGGNCPVNDVAIAVAAVREEGFAGRVVVLDLDAHPPDGLAACLAKDRNHWIGSLSGSDWGPLEGVDEVVLAEGTRSREYLDALRMLLARMPRPQLAFVIAGGDVLAGDRLGRLGLSLEGARLRDLMVAAALAGVPSVWLPGGGYHPDAWRVLAGTGMALAAGSLQVIPPDTDPLARRFAGISESLSHELLSESGLLTNDDLEEALGFRRRRQRLLLGFYTSAGMEHALYRYGVLDQLQRLGYANFRVAVDSAGMGQRVRVFGEADGAEHLLIEGILEKRWLGNVQVLYVHWFTLRNERVRFSQVRPQLPGQEVPGLGLAHEAGEMLALMAVRLGLAGVVFRPTHYHMAFAARSHFTFVDATRQGRFDALVRDLSQLSLLEATQAVDENRVLLDGRPYSWEADEMAFWLRESPHDPQVVAKERERVHFTVRPVETSGPGAPGT
jgi:acetoin utilization deacetylase AcuC-like enzyme